jgi:hypothetical protein
MSCEYDVTFAYNQVFLTFIGSIVDGFVNIFVLLSGFLLCDKKFSYHRIVSLWLQVYFVCLLVTVITLIIDPHSFRIEDLVKTFIPVISGNYWYILVYFILCFAIPYYNRIIMDLDKSEFKGIIIKSTLLFTICLSANPFIDSLHYLGESCTFFWFSYIYMGSLY